MLSFRQINNRFKQTFLSIMKHFLFSYGTLQLKEVQLDTYGRLLTGSPDSLTGYVLGELRIKDANVVNISGKSIHPVAIKTGRSEDRIEGVIFEITEDELLQTDEYEDIDYIRVMETFNSGRSAWIYVENPSRY